MKFFLTLLATSEPLSSKKFQTTLILAFEANSALSCENETKIVKITHSAVVQQLLRYNMILFLKKMNEIYIGTTEDNVNNVAHMTCLDIYSICFSSGRHK